MTDATCVTPAHGPAIGPISAPAASAAPVPHTAHTGRAATLDSADGWQALALAVLDRELTGPELVAAERLPVDVALDLFFPDLDDAARHEALWALDRPPA